MRVSDRPGRYFALMIMSPTLIFISYRVCAHHPLDGCTLFALGVGLFAYELFWVCQTDAEIMKRGPDREDH